MATWIVKYSYKEHVDSVERESNIMVEAKSWYAAKKVAAEQLEGRYPYVQVLTAYQQTTHVNKAEKDARVINTINEKLLEYNIGIMILTIVLYVVAGILLLAGIIGIIYRATVPAPEEPELLAIYNGLLIPTIIGLIVGPLLGIGAFLLFKLKGKKK